MVDTTPYLEITCLRGCIIKDDIVACLKEKPSSILPRICIHGLIEEECSNFYIPQEDCDFCGETEWIEGEMDIVKPLIGYPFPKKKVERCSKCQEVRIAYYK